MEPVITAAESRRLDAEAGVSVDVLMDHAGLAVALAAAEMGAGYGSRVAVVAGKGNNGGDGYVAARYLRGRGAAVTVHALGAPEPHSPAGRAAAAARAVGVPVVPIDDPVHCDLVIDALFGSGFRGDLPDIVLPWARHDAPVLAVDMPSGCETDTGDAAPGSFSADRTVTFGARKLGHLLGDGPARCGEVTVADIGLPDPVAELWIADAESSPLPDRAKDAHKWSAGSVLVVGGAPGMSGAALLAARAALHFGVGSVRLAVPGNVVERVAAAAPEILLHSSRGHEFGLEDANDLAAMADRFDVLVFGPGLGRACDGFARSLLDQWVGRRVIDADALGAAGSLGRLDGPGTIVTPHAGEWKRLTGRPASYEAVREERDDLELTVLLKGSPTFVVAEDVVAVTSGGPELATIGTGDVLAGMIGALLARGLDAPIAARSAAHWHGVAGADLSTRESVTADRLAEAIGRWAW